MRIRSLLWTAALAISSFTAANAKSYDIMLSEKSMAGPVELKAGEYKVKVEGSNAIFTSMDSNRSFTVPVKIEEGTEKFDQTAVQSQNTGAEPRLTTIELGGSHTKLQFGQENPTSGQ